MISQINIKINHFFIDEIAYKTVNSAVNENCMFLRHRLFKFDYQHVGVDSELCKNVKLPNTYGTNARGYHQISVVCEIFSNVNLTLL